MKFARNLLLVSFVLVVFSGISFANMKKGRVAGGGSKGFAFSTFSDGFCTASVIYDTSRSLIGIGVGLPSGDLVCVGISSQASFQSCTAGLPAGDYEFVVVSLSGASSFRSVMNCSDQQVITTSGTATTGIQMREVELDAGGRKLANQVKSLLEKASKR